jgi:alpha-1,2-mannosyltransferase
MDDRPLYRWERVATAALVPLFLGFGLLTLIRSAYDPDNRKTDFGVYARAAWAVRTGHDLYSSADDNGWHYVYPPPFVLLFLPLADPPKEADRTGFLPYPAGVVTWYFVNVGLLAFALNAFASAALPNVRRYSARWWYARVIPFDLCIASVGFTLSRGQANILVVALIAGMYAAAMRNRRFASGLWLAGACCLKIFPGLLLLFPIVRRDWRALVGVVVGTILLLGVLPGVAFGPKGAVRETERFLKFVAAPGLFSPDVYSAEDQALVKALAEELHDMTAKQSQSFMAVIHYMRYPQGGPRPQKPDADAKAIHFAMSGLMVLLAWGAAERAGRKSNLLPSQWLVILGNFSTAMLLIVPMSHMHYYCMMLPHIAGLYLLGMATHPGRVGGSPRITAVLVAWGALNAVPLLPGCTILNDYGFATFTTLALWVYSVCLTFGFRAR